jgi:hypothetical protein
MIMNRRTFFKCVGGALVGVAGLSCLLPKRKQGLTVEDVRKARDELAVAEPEHFISTTHGIIDFPEEIISLGRFGDRFFVFGENSVWEIMPKNKVPDKKFVATLPNYA